MPPTARGGRANLELLGQATKRRRRWQTRHVPNPARELADLRAWLTAALRMTRREPGPAGLTVLSVPSDRELIDEVRRLRALADLAEGTGHHMPRRRPLLRDPHSSLFAVDHLA
jgi:hypothetical protein